MGEVEGGSVAKGASARNSEADKLKSGGHVSFPWFWTIGVHVNRRIAVPFVDLPNLRGCEGISPFRSQAGMPNEKYWSGKKLQLLAR